MSLKSLAQRYLELHDDRRPRSPHAALVDQLAPDLLARVGIGYESATQLLITAGDNPDRLSSECLLRAAARRCTTAGLLRDDDLSPAQPRRRPRRQLRPTHDRHQPLAHGPRDPGLRRLKKTEQHPNLEIPARCLKR